MNDEPQFAQSRVIGQMFFDQGFERAASGPIAMGVADIVGVESDGPLLPLDQRDLGRIDEPKLGTSIDETAHQPAGRRTVDPDLPAGNPEHHALLATYGRRLPATRLPDTVVT